MARGPWPAYNVTIGSAVLPISERIEIMTDTTYNGWTNYATWRVNLEVFDGFDYTESGFEGLSIEDTSDIWDLSEYLKGYAEECIFSHAYDERGRASLMEDYARAFLQDVNWYEIARNMVRDHVDA